MEERVRLLSLFFVLPILMWSCSSVTSPSDQLSTQKTHQESNVPVVSGEDTIPLPPSDKEIAQEATQEAKATKTAKTQILFCRYDPIESSNDIYVIEPDGSNMIQLTRGLPDDRYPDWSPDKSKIVFHSNRESHGIPCIYIMDADGSNISALTKNAENYQFPAWSPDGDRIAFSGVKTVNTEGSDEVEYADGTLPRWFPDGNNILYIASDGGFYRIKSTDASGTSKDYNIKIIFPYWTNATHTSDPGMPPQLPSPALIPSAEFNGKKFGGKVTSDIPWIDLSPDGRRILYTNDVRADGQNVRIDAENRGREIFVYDIDSGKTTRLTNNNVADDYPCWSPVGEMIVFGRWALTPVAERTIQWQKQQNYYTEESGIYIMAADGSNPSRIAGTSGFDWPVKWR